MTEPPIPSITEAVPTTPAAEHIPDEAELVRFLTEGEFDTYMGKVVVSVNSLKDPLLSVDWLSRTSLADGYARKPKSKAHAVFLAKKAREIEQDVLHKPKAENLAHSQIECPDRLRERGKRRPAIAGLLLQTVASTGARGDDEPTESHEST